MLSDGRSRFSEMNQFPALPFKDIVGTARGDKDHRNKKVTLLSVTPEVLFKEDQSWGAWSNVKDYRINVLYPRNSYNIA